MRIRGRVIDLTLPRWPAREGKTLIQIVSELSETECREIACLQRSLAPSRMVVEMVCPPDPLPEEPSSWGVVTEVLGEILGCLAGSRLLWGGIALTLGVGVFRRGMRWIATDLGSG